jgi:hypothetical protein
MLTSISGAVAGEHMPGSNVKKCQQQSSPKYFLFPVQVPFLDFCKFSKWFKIPQWCSQIAQGV